MVKNEMSVAGKNQSLSNSCMNNNLVDKAMQNVEKNGDGFSKGLVTGLILGVGLTLHILRNKEANS